MKVVDQGEDLLADVGLLFPSRTVSSVLLIGERGSISAADIAKVLEQPHQLVTQRVDLLIKLGIAERTGDPDDARRKILKLTQLGHTQLELLQRRLAQATQVFDDLFIEIECDLSAIAMRAMSALDRQSITERANSLKHTDKNDIQPDRKSLP